MAKYKAKNFDKKKEKQREIAKLVGELNKCTNQFRDKEKILELSEKILALQPDESTIVEKIAGIYISYKMENKADEAVTYLEKNFPPSARRLMYRIHLCELKKQSLDAIKFANQALSYNDIDIIADIVIHNLRGQAYRRMGNAQKAIDNYKINVKRKIYPQKDLVILEKIKNLQILEYSNYLLNMHNLNFSREELFEEACGFNKLLAHIPRFKHDREKHAAHKRIRVGYISPDIRYHVVAFFSAYLFTSYDRTTFEVFIYSNNLIDMVAKELISTITGFRYIIDKSPAEVAEQIMQDEIDILIDLAGHTANNLLKVMAYKPAPIQISGIGYFDSTGLDTIDYFLADKFTDPEGLNDKFFTEKILRLQHSHFCYKWHDYPFMQTPTPCLKKGYVTFVSFNNFSKITEEVLSVWSKILSAVPNSRLFLKHMAYTEKSGLNFAREKIQAAGIDLERVDMEDMERKYLHKYWQADIALDTFPYPGGGTTCDALYMGVPVITLVGERHNSRFGYSLLMNMGLEELCAFSEEEYIQKAIDLANDWERLNEYHLTIRRKMEESPVMNDVIYMGEIEQAYEKIFSAWINGKPLPDFPQEPEPITEELAKEYYKRAMFYLPLEGKIDVKKIKSRFDFKRTLYFAQLAAQCESVCDAPLYLTIADRQFLLGDNIGAYETMKKAMDYIYSPKGEEKNYSKDFITECYRKLAKFAQENRRHVEGLESYESALNLTEDFEKRLGLYDAILLGLHFLDISGEELAAFHFDYQKFFEDVEPFTTYHAPHDRIKVGYISGDFRKHAAFDVVFGFMSCHDRSKFEITCYSKNPEDDDYTEFYKQAVEHYVDVKDLSGEELAKKIHDDEIDIAFDLAGHTGYNGLPALVYRPAPVQICGIGYMSTTGLKEIDYFLTDEVLDPPGENREQYFSEKFLYMPAQFSYAHREDLPVPNGAPCVENGYVTFGTICRYKKISDEMLTIWIEILKRVPDAKLLMRSQEFISNQLVDVLYEKMKSLGCDMGQVIFRPAVPDYFDAISKIDIILDAYPYVGGVTTLDALYMGVPVINFYGERHSTRFGKSILESIGLPELSVNSVEDYINRAVGLAKDFETLNLLHKNLRDMFLNSSALDPMKYCRRLERKFEEILNGNLGIRE